jgi:ABC-2 type transport system permease protein
MLFGVLYFVFTEVVRFGKDVPNYPVYLLSSLMMWTFFSESTSAAVKCLVDRENLIRKIRFPRMVIPLAVVLTALFNFAASLVAVFVFIFASGIEPRLTWFEIPLILAALAVLAMGAGMLLSALYVRFRDIEPIWNVGLQILFYGSPILYVVSFFPDSVEKYFAANPISMVVTQWRHAVIYPSAPTAAASMGGGPVLLLIPLAIIAVVFFVGLWTFNRETPHIAENL